MQYQVVIPKPVQKQLDRIDSRYRHRILVSLKKLEVDPFLGKKLEGDHEGERSLRVWPYRVIYRVLDRELLIMLVRIGHRQGVY